MSGECSIFRFCLRGTNSLSCKWISQKRGAGLKEDGANLYSISDYIHHVFYFENLYGQNYNSNILFNRIIEANEFDKDYIVKFDEVIKIPFSFSPRTYNATSFDELAKEIENEPLADVKLIDLLNKEEIKEMLINTYHIIYDLRGDENISEKTYDEIINEAFLDTRGSTKLSLFLPYIFEIPAKKVVGSTTESPVAVVLTESSVLPEVTDITVEGYFYTEDGEYAGKYGKSEKCYAVNEIKEKYKVQNVIDLKINHDNFTFIPGVLIHEDSSSFESLAILTQTTFNAVKIKKGDSITIEEQAKYAVKLLKSDYSSVPNKTALKDDNDKESKLARKALIHVLTGGNDYSNGCIVWDGVDFVLKGKKHNKSALEGGISITKEMWKSFLNIWFPNENSVVPYRGNEYKKSDCIDNIPFLKDGLTEKEKEEAIAGIKKDCSNLYKVTNNLFETYKSEIRSGYPNSPGGKKEFKWVLNKAERIAGKSIFWKADKERNRGYAWKNYFTDARFL